MSQPTVLIVEDEPAQAEVLAYNLEAEGFHVITADNGEDALILVDENMPDLIILDWMMPHISGIEVCRRLKCGLKPALFRLLCCQPDQRKLIGCGGLRLGQTIM